MTNTAMEELDSASCLELLRMHSLGRIAVIAEGFPVVLPVNYRLIEGGENAWLVIRTRPGNVIDTAMRNVAFQIDGADPFHSTGWSVLVRGTLRHLDDATIAAIRDRFDPQPWLHEQRDSWLVIEPRYVTGRRLRAADVPWAFHVRAYL